MVNQLVKGELAWPVTECEACGFNLREATPKASEKSNDESKRLKWTAFCPRCGKGYFVGDRSLPLPNEEELARRKDQAILTKEPVKGLKDLDPEHLITPGEVTSSEASGIPPDQRGKELTEEIDPEGLLSQEPAPGPDGIAIIANRANAANLDEEPGAVKPPGKGQFFCTKCASNHNEKSKVGVRHNKYREA